jgi:hypothetical protein
LLRWRTDEDRMARSQLSALVLVMAIATAGCDGGSDKVARSSVTVKLPPARSHSAEPAFSFGGQGRPGRAKERAGDLSSNGSL